LVYKWGNPFPSTTEYILRLAAVEVRLGYAEVEERPDG
jgi:hypothetical protein